MIKKVGGFFPLHISGKKITNNLISLWGIEKAAMFTNGRSALNFLLNEKGPDTFWLPAYSCESLAEAAKGRKLKFYPIKENLSPNSDFLKKNIKKDDAVLAIDYFGRLPDSEFIKTVESMPDIVWVEDRAQALSPGKAWAKHILYSPRKLVGAPDGGIITGVSKEHKLRPDGDFIKPFKMRLEDKAEKNNQNWYTAYVKYENAMNVSNKSMSQITYDILASLNAKDLIKKRKKNFSILLSKLNNMAVIKEKPEFTPFGFPIKVKDRKKVLGFLHANFIFAAHHWPELPSPKSFKFEHEFADHVITIPCDQRYNAADMKHIISLIEEAPGI